jgi:thiol-disulfide isomerase/thioredoxin
MRRTAKNRSNKKHSKKIILGKIYANWCGHCKMLIPEWNHMKILINKSSKRNNVAVEYREIESENQDIQLNQLNQLPHYPKVELQGGYPTIFKIVDGKVEYYNGPRTSVDMMKWCMNGMKSHKKTRRHRM